jgi:hypothetical protein
MSYTRRLNHLVTDMEVVYHEGDPELNEPKYVLESIHLDDEDITQGLSHPYRKDLERRLNSILEREEQQGIAEWRSKKD